MMKKKESPPRDANFKMADGSWRTAVLLRTTTNR
jgi:hypothetical protein